MRKRGLETAAGNSGWTSAVSLEARGVGWGPWKSCRCCAHLQLPKDLTAEPDDLRAWERTGSVVFFVGRCTWVAITMASSWFQPPVCLGLYAELGEGDTPSLMAAEGPSCYLLQLTNHGPQSNCQVLPPGSHRQTQTKPLQDRLSQSLAPQNPKSKCNVASCSEAKAKPGRLSGEGRWQAELSDPQSPAQILSHDLMTSWHASFYLCHPSSHLLAHLCPRLRLSFLRSAA